MQNPHPDLGALGRAPMNAAEYYFPPEHADSQAVESPHPHLDQLDHCQGYDP
jgi:hypothetical protein